MKTLYLWLNIATILFPLVFSFDKKVAFYKHWRYLFPAIFITALVFLAWDELFTLWHVWSFNHLYLLGYYVWDLPLEELLFFITVPYACVFLYECLQTYIKRDIFSPVRWYLSALIMLGAIALVYLNQKHLYTAVTGLILALLLGMHALVIKRRYMSWFYLAYVVSLVPMFIINGILTAKPVVIYNPAQITGYRIGSIPVEDFLYNMAMLVMCTGLYEIFKRWGHRSHSNHPKQSS